MGALTSVSNRPAQSLAMAAATVVTPPLPSSSTLPAPIPPLPSRWISVVAAAVILGLFSVLFARMYGNASDGAFGEVSWSRLLLLYNGVQTIVVAAASALLGFQVSTGQVAAAVADGAKARNEAAKLTSNIKSFQADLARQPSQSEKIDSNPSDSCDWVTARAMTLLH